MEGYRIPIGHWGELLINYSVENFKPVFGLISTVIIFINGWLNKGLHFLPPWLIIIIAIIFIWRLVGLKASVYALISLLLLWNLGIWKITIDTLSLVLTAATLSLIVAIPIGILMAESKILTALLTPALDFLQTMPRFIYLIPGVIIFGIGDVPGVIATMTLAVPPPVRLTALGIMQVDGEVIEAGEAFGCSRWQLLRKVKLPLALPSIVLGVNQCIMMSLSMVVIAAMIGGGGLGEEILMAISLLSAGQGLVAGLGVIVIAIFIDRACKGWIYQRTARLQGKTEFSGG